MSLWLAASDVRPLSPGVLPASLGFTDDSAFNSWIESSLLPMCQSIIEDFCEQTFDPTTVPASIKAVCALLAGRIMKEGMLLGGSSTQHLADFSVQVTAFKVFDTDLKDLLLPYAKSRGIFLKTW